MFRTYFLLLVLFVVAVESPPVLSSEGKVYHTLGETITAYSGWNVTGTIDVLIITENSNDCATVWWAGVTNRQLGEHCGKFTIDYKIEPYHFLSLRIGGFKSPAIVISIDHLEGLTRTPLIDLAGNTPYYVAVEIYGKCGTDTECWKDNL